MNTDSILNTVSGSSIRDQD